MKKQILLLIFIINTSMICEDNIQFTISIGIDSYHRSSDRKIQLSYDRNNAIDNIYDLLHEYGHYIDDIIVDNKVKRNKFNNIIDSHIEIISRNKKPKLNYSKEQLKDFRKCPIQDIINALSNGKHRYTYGHPRGYWTRDKIYKEVFANLYVLYIVNDKEQIRMLDDIAPNLYTEFVIFLVNNELRWR